MLTFPTLLCHKAFFISKTKCAVLKYEMCRFQIRRMWQFQIRKMCQLQIRKLCQFQIQKMCQLQIRKMCHFQIQKMFPFQIRECAISKYEKRTFLNTKITSASKTKMRSFQYKNVSFPNTKNVLWSACIFKYECYLFLQQTTRHK